MSDVPGRAACTIVSKPWVAQARVLANSFNACHPDVPMFVLLADEASAPFDAVLEPYHVVDIRTIDIPGFEHFRFRYAQQQLTYAATPFFLTYLLAHGFERVLFFKQESLVLGSHEEVFDLLDRYDVVLTPHLVSPLSGAGAIERELNILQSGAYNVGLLGVSDRPSARQFADWWQQRTLTHCLHDVKNGMHWEQRWLSLAPAMFDGVHILRDARFNVGHWNLPDRRIEMNGSRVLVNGEDCRLFRFSGFQPEEAHTVTRHNQRLSPVLLGPAWQVFERFRSLLLEAGHTEVSRWPYAWATFDNGTPIPGLARQLFGHLGDDVTRFGDPRVTGDRSFFAWLQEPVDETAEPANRVTRLWEAAYRTRPDVMAAFPDHLGSHRLQFLEWTRRSGWREMEIDPVFVPGGVA